MSRTLKECLDEGVAKLKAVGVESAPRDAEVLLGAVLSWDRTRMMANRSEPISDAHCARYADLIHRRSQREPVAYLTGEREFWSLGFHISPEVLIPRPETEVLVERCLQVVLDHTGWRHPRILEIGTGSGAIAVALATELPRATFVATDISASALEVAAKNVAAHHLDGRITLRRGSLFDPLEKGERFHLVVSNPPYIAESERGRLMADVVRYEPEIALFAGRDGLDVIRPLISGAVNVMVPGGILAFEHGASQGAEVRRLMSRERWLEVSTQKDYSGLDRLTLGSASERS